MAPRVFLPSLRAILSPSRSPVVSLRIINKNLPLRREEVSREEAQRRIKEINEPYKLEILEGIKSEPITIYHIGDEWWDLCAGPHVERTGELPKGGFELEAVAGAYWRGDENRQMLQRVYGTAWESAEQLKEYKRLKEEALRRDHRRIGKDLNLFSIQEEAGGGLVFWHPKGAIMRHLIEDYWKSVHLREGYELIYSPHVAKLDLWKTSGHFDFYRENMFDQMQIENESYQLRPMNCPFHITVYKDGMHSYRDLPFRWAELGTVYRYEKSGTMHGLFRVRGFTQVDFNLPDRFGLFYIDKDNCRARPIMIHRAIFGSLERFFGILIENYAGDFPLWISPVQVRVLPVTDLQVDYGSEVVRQLKDAGFRAELSSGERLPKLIRNAEKARTPVMIVVGPKEVETSTLAVRTRHSGDLGSLHIDDLMTKLSDVVSSAADEQGFAGVALHGGDKEPLHPAGSAVLTCTESQECGRNCAKVELRRLQTAAAQILAEGCEELAEEGLVDKMGWVDAVAVLGIGPSVREATWHWPTAVGGGGNPVLLSGLYLGLYPGYVSLLASAPENEGSLGQIRHGTTIGTSDKKACLGLQTEFALPARSVA
ncbi:hypothetical protein CBR_g3851 [Chara braunii]|uniref:threonine--tRNA ligase n=1 Tax=Chara braunii TaxID=69332 RepID=A0A388KGH8_CHABU|nr:hypothetical protein CBR_g3851 [Chara braunii]|eukprot:GBG69151.1 hypothetical protein CBR_g3851 [Chara braunii]